jgi:hypothetical protein
MNDGKEVVDIIECDIGGVGVTEWNLPMVVMC